MHTLPAKQDITDLAVLLTGVGTEVIMACMDPTLVRINKCTVHENTLQHTWSSAAPEQIEAVIYHAIRERAGIEGCSFVLKLYNTRYASY